MSDIGIDQSKQDLEKWPSGPRLQVLIIGTTGTLMAWLSTLVQMEKTTFPLGI